MSNSTGHPTRGTFPSSKFQTRCLRRWRLRRRRVARFSHDKRGSMAIEFALVALPFFLIILAIFETALMFFADLMLDSSVATAARMVRTGQAQEQSLNETAFKNLICSNIPGVIKCNDLKVDVRAFPDFGGISLPSNTDDDGELQNNFAYQIGTASEVVVIRVYYPWQLFTPTHITGLSNMSGNKRLLITSAAFRNEPF